MTAAVTERPTRSKTKVASLSARQAANLWNKLRTQFLAFQDTLEEIIEKKAWEPMGYGSFHEAWAAKMSDITLAAELRPHVVYQMLAEGLDVDEIAASVKGVGRDRAESLARQRSNGVPARDASLSTPRKGKWFNKSEDTTVVSEHLRKKPSAPDTIHIKLGALKLQRYHRIAKKHGLPPVEEIARQLLEEKFAELG